MSGPAVHGITIKGVFMLHMCILQCTDSDATHLSTATGGSKLFVWAESDQGGNLCSKQWLWSTVVVPLLESGLIDWNAAKRLQFPEMECEIFKPSHAEHKMKAVMLLPQAEALRYIH
jgi:hypothetical protein